MWTCIQNVKFSTYFAISKCTNMWVLGNANIWQKIIFKIYLMRQKKIQEVNHPLNVELFLELSIQHILRFRIVWNMAAKWIFSRHTVFGSFSSIYLSLFQIKLYITEMELMEPGPGPGRPLGWFYLLFSTFPMPLEQLQFWF